MLPNWPHEWIGVPKPIFLFILAVATALIFLLGYLVSENHITKPCSHCEHVDQVILLSHDNKTAIQTLGILTGYDLRSIWEEPEDLTDEIDKRKADPLSSSRGQEFQLKGD